MIIHQGCFNIFKSFSEYKRKLNSKKIFTPSSNSPPDLTTLPLLTGS